MWHAPPIYSSRSDQIPIKLLNEKRRAKKTVFYFGSSKLISFSKVIDMAWPSVLYKTLYWKEEITKCSRIFFTLVIIIMIFLMFFITFIFLFYLYNGKCSERNDAWSSEEKIYVHTFLYYGLAYKPKIIPRICMKTGSVNFRQRKKVSVFLLLEKGEREKLSFFNCATLYVYYCIIYIMWCDLFLSSSLFTEVCVWSKLKEG